MLVKKFRDINFATNKLIVFSYPADAGGKFIAMACNLHKNILPQDQWSAEYQMQDDANSSHGFNLTMSTLVQTKRQNKHIELGCNNLAGFFHHHIIQDPDADQKLCTDFWKYLTHQNKYYFCMVDHHDGTVYKKYKNRKTVRLVNYQWIMDARHSPMESPAPKQTDSVDFDMTKVHDKTQFAFEIDKVLDYLDLEPNYNKGHLETCRKAFKKTVKIGFTKAGNIVGTLYIDKDSKQRYT